MNKYADILTILLLEIEELKQPTKKTLVMPLHGFLGIPL
jgi:hypothetical protein